MNFHLDSIRFRINVEFPDCDVDAIYTERRLGPTVLTALAGAKQHVVQSQSTPTAASVDACLEALCESQEIKKLGVRVVEWYGLMMGCCHFLCEIEADKYAPELTESVIAIAKQVFAKQIRYYKPNQKLSN